MTNFLKTIISFILPVFIGTTSPSHISQKIEPKNLPPVVATTTIKISHIADKPLAASTTATTTTKLKKVSKMSRAIMASQSEVTSLTTTSPSAVNIVTSTPVIKTDFESLNQSLRPAVVNIFCTENSQSGLSFITGSGVTIDPSGVILTNAHIAQFWLLKNFGNDNKIDCIVRTGSPAYPTYKAELLYISPHWVSDNLDLLKTYVLKGTGEHDFALLRITGPVDSSVKMPSEFPYISPSVSGNLAEKQPTLLISYPAKLVGSEIVLRSLNKASAMTDIKKLYTFKEAGENVPVDVVALGGTVVTQTGSSGGAAINGDGKLVGIITTESDNEATSTAGLSLYAITLNHIDRSLVEETGADLFTMLTFARKDATAVSKTFMDTVGNNLSEMLIKTLIKK